MKIIAKIENEAILHFRAKKLRQIAENKDNQGGIHSSWNWIKYTFCLNLNRFLF